MFLRLTLLHVSLLADAEWRRKLQRQVCVGSTSEDCSLILHLIGQVHCVARPIYRCSAPKCPNPAAARRLRDQGIRTAGRDRVRLTDYTSTTDTDVPRLGFVTTASCWTPFSLLLRATQLQIHHSPESSHSTTLLAPLRITLMVIHLRACRIIRRSCYHPFHTVTAARTQ